MSLLLNTTLYADIVFFPLLDIYSARDSGDSPTIIICAHWMCQNGAGDRDRGATGCAQGTDLDSWDWHCCKLRNYGKKATAFIRTKSIATETRALTRSHDRMFTWYQCRCLSLTQWISVIRTKDSYAHMRESMESLSTSSLILLRILCQLFQSFSCNIHESSVIHAFSGVLNVHYLPQIVVLIQYVSAAELAVGRSWPIFGIKAGPFALKLNGQRRALLVWTTRSSASLFGFLTAIYLTNRFVFMNTKFGRTTNNSVWLAFGHGRTSRCSEKS